MNKVLTAGSMVLIVLAVMEAFFHLYDRATYHLVLGIWIGRLASK